MTLRRTEQQHPLAAGMQDRPVAAVLDQMLAVQREAAAAVAAALPEIEAAAGKVAAVLRDGGRIGYAGAGSSGLMALSDALELPGTFGISADRVAVIFAGGTAALLHMTGDVEDDADSAARDFQGAGLGRGDALICVSASGSTPYALAAAAAAREAGAAVIGLANAAGTSLLAIADIAVLLDTGPELVAGSTRMGAGTAQKIALNLISTAAGLHLGHVHDGYMVNVVADNTKLGVRARGIVAALSGADANRADAALAEAGGAVKPAIVLAAGAEDAAAARAMLDASGGRLGPALAALYARI